MSNQSYIGSMGYAMDRSTPAPKVETPTFTAPTGGVLGGALSGNVQSSWDPSAFSMAQTQSPLISTTPSYTDSLLNNYSVPEIDSSGLAKVPAAPTIIENFQNTPDAIDIAGQSKLAEWDKSRQELYDKGMKSADRMGNIDPVRQGRIAGGVALAGQAADLVGDTLAKGAAAEDSARRKANDAALRSAYEAPLNAFSKAPDESDFNIQKADVGGKSVAASTLKGLATGATIGTTLGTVVPVIGNAVGGLIGAAVGTLGGLFAGIFGGRKKARKENEDAQRKADQLYRQRLEAWRAARRSYESKKNAADAEKLRQMRDLERQRELDAAGNAASSRQKGLINTANVALQRAAQPISTGLNRYRAPLFSY